MTKLTKAEREELRRLHERAADAAWSKRRFADLPLTDCQLAVAARNALPRLLADLDAAEAERDELRIALIACGKVVGASVSECCSAEFLCHVPQEALKFTDRLWRQATSAEAQRDRAESELATLRADRDAALIHLPVCCGSLADAADTLRQERDELVAERDALKAKLAALVEAAHQSVLIAKDESRGGPCGQAEPSLTINAEVCRRMTSIRVLLTPAIAAAKVTT